MILKYCWIFKIFSEQEILREEVRGLQQARDRLRQRVAALEEELKKTKEEAEAAAKATKSDDEEDVPLSQRKRFTRVEMARVLMERNQYKERFMELQEAVRWTEMIRASKTDPSSISGGKGSVWKLYVYYTIYMFAELKDTKEKRVNPEFLIQF